jgi:hypothetical protein
VSVKKLLLEPPVDGSVCCGDSKVVYRLELDSVKLSENEDR